MGGDASKGNRKESPKRGERGDFIGESRISKGSKVSFGEHPEAIRPSLRNIIEKLSFVKPPRREKKNFFVKP
jgi:hypothetical protein